MTPYPAKLRARIEDTWHCVKSLNRKDLEKERTLHQTKWFDYRFISPLEATRQFRDVFSQINQRKYAQNIDAETASARIGVRRGPAFQRKTELTSFWRARQAADTYGLPYKVFIEVAFEHFIRAGCKQLPHINQLYGERNIELVYVKAASFWEELQDTDFGRSFSHRPEYRTESFQSFPAQIAHRAWVIDLLKKKGSPMAIGRAHLVNRVIPPEMAVAEYGEEKVARAREEVAGEAVDPVEVCAPGQMLPSCVGLPGALVPASPECTACPARSLCSQMAEAVLASLKKITGSENPEHEQRKKQQRDRTRRCRAKMKCLSGIPLSTAEPLSHPAASDPDPVTRP